MLGILGGGQLGRMFAAAAKTCGYRVTVADPDPDAPAADFADVHICAAFNSREVFAAMAQCAAVTTEFENVDAAVMTALAAHTRVSPAGASVAVAQNRISEKAAVVRAGLPVAPYLPLTAGTFNADADAFAADVEKLLPGILKTATLGYDGKGQYPVENLAQLRAVLTAAPAAQTFVLEKKMDLRAELSVIVCRLDDANCTTFPPAENIHRNGILAFSTVPARLPETLLRRARDIAKNLAHALDYVGVLAVEMFVVGADDLLINEIAPRPHNSGHYTLDAASADQFLQQVRLMCALPPEQPALLTPCCMVNILGDVWGADGAEPDWRILLQEPNVRLHLYGKKEARPGRKMGHFTVLADDAAAALATAQRLDAKLRNSVQAA